MNWLSEQNICAPTILFNVYIKIVPFNGNPTSLITNFRIRLVLIAEAELVCGSCLLSEYVE